MAAIAKARAAADKAEQRADRHDAEAAKTVDDAPRGRQAGQKAATVPSGQDAQAPQEQAGAASSDGAPALPTYDARAHRDPFTPPRLNSTADARTPLETYQIGQLKLVGVVAQPPQGYRAMVEDSAGLGYIITTGTPIGSSGGVVRSIESRRVVIEESTRDFYGDVKPKEVVMELPQEDRSP
ncbi:MAG: pilus assembly protein PilP [Deltaproteobacteria bacterium]|nr:pilus assembly protein PilP [Deltaproteobacteria bacterium]